jgi:ATP-dependent RNA helicase DeaD
MQNQFSDLGIAPLVQALTEMKIVINRDSAKTIPLLLSNTTDVVGLAKTGTGKQRWIAYFTINRYKCTTAVQAVILVPTRTRASNFEI